VITIKEPGEIPLPLRWAPCDATSPPKRATSFTTLLLRKLWWAAVARKSVSTSVARLRFVWADLQFELEIGHGPQTTQDDGGAGLRA